MKDDVLKVLESERKYQDFIWGDTSSDDKDGDGSRSVDEFALYISGYTNELVYQASHFGNPKEKLEIVRKIGALCVACMEQHETPLRK